MSLFCPCQRKTAERILQIGFTGDRIGDLSDSILIEWCDREPDVRYPLVAAVGMLFKRPSEKAPNEWTSLGPELLAKAPDPVAVLREIETRLYPRAYRGSVATKLLERLQLLERLEVASSELIAAKEAAGERLQQRIEIARQRQAEENRSGGASSSSRESGTAADCMATRCTAPARTACFSR